MPNNIYYWAFFIIFVINMNDLKINILVLSKDLSNSSFKEFKVKMVHKNDQILFEANLPGHIYDFLIENNVEVKKKLSCNVFSVLKEMFQFYCDKVDEIVNKKELIKDKKIFVNFDYSKTADRHEWCGADMGNKILTNFQFFIGYKTVEKNVKRSFESETIDKITYYSYYKNRTNGRNHKDGKLQPLHYEWKSSELNRFTILDWTQEREDFLRSIENQFIKLGQNLKDYLSDIDELLIDHYIKHQVKLLK